ncbi:hypothetical protein B0H34DRAFT_823032 [Crassisporium funariophilum]|nr:hypothetical protein B0H34DRAFT_823032 [Crassisporium funariophilum]
MKEMMLEVRVEMYQRGGDEWKKRYWKERRHTIRSSKANQQLKANMKNIKCELVSKRGTVWRIEANLGMAQKDAESSLSTLQGHIRDLKNSQVELKHNCRLLQRCCKQMVHATQILKNKMQELAQRRPKVYKLKRKCVYTRKRCALA